MTFPAHVGEGSWRSRPRPGWKQGLARSASESIRPQLWKGLLGAWCANLGPTGATVRDASGHGHDGTIVSGGPTDLWKTDGALAGWAFKFDRDGAGNHIDVPTIPLPLTKTFSFWIKSVTISNAWNTILEGGGGDNPWIGVNPTNGSFTWYNSLVTSSAVAVNGIWYHIVMTNNDENNTSALYINGFLDDTGIGGNQSGTGMTIGHGGGEQKWDGWMDDFRVYGRELTAGEVKEDYNLGPGGIFIPVRTRSYFVAPAAGGLSIPVAMASYRRRHERCR